MYRILGLSNPENEHKNTPHNIGGDFIYDLFWKSNFNIFQDSSGTYNNKKRSSEISEGSFVYLENNSEKSCDYEIIFSKTFMNNSGDVFSGIFPKFFGQKKRKKIAENIIVIHDDIDLPLGQIKISFGRGDGGHNGIKDIIRKIKTKNFIRIRLGVTPVIDGEIHKPKGNSVSKYLVGKKFSKQNLEEFFKIEKKVEEILKEIFKNGYKKAMNEFN